MGPAEATDTIVQTLTLPSPREVERMGTAELRGAFLLADLFQPGRLSLVFTSMDRMVVGGAVPHHDLVLPALHENGTRSFQERRETGIINIGDRGTVVVGETRYSLERFDCLYIGKGEHAVRLCRSDEGQPAFFLCSAPGHHPLPTTLTPANSASAEPLGDEAHASRRCVRKQIHLGGAASCQLVMGRTELAENSVWNTMPAHTHGRRSEVYLYIGLDDGMAVHLMGTPGNTRHLIVRDRQAVLSPGWSIHSGCGTHAYTFVWAMAGENQDFADVDAAATQDLL